jgi:hypothetical protein
MLRLKIDAIVNCNAASIVLHCLHDSTSEKRGTKILQKSASNTLFMQKYSKKLYAP